MAPTAHPTCSWYARYSLQGDQLALPREVFSLSHSHYHLVPLSQGTPVFIFSPIRWIVASTSCKISLPNRNIEYSGTYRKEWMSDCSSNLCSNGSINACSWPSLVPPSFCASYDWVYLIWYSELSKWHWGQLRIWQSNPYVQCQPGLLGDQLECWLSPLVPSFFICLDHLPWRVVARICHLHSSLWLVRTLSFSVFFLFANGALIRS